MSSRPEDIVRQSSTIAPFRVGHFRPASAKMAAMCVLVRLPLSFVSRHVPSSRCFYRVSIVLRILSRWWLVACFRPGPNRLPLFGCEGGHAFDLAREETFEVRQPFPARGIAGLQGGRDSQRGVSRFTSSKPPMKMRLCFYVALKESKAFDLVVKLLGQQIGREGRLLLPYVGETSTSVHLASSPALADLGVCGSSEAKYSPKVGAFARLISSSKVSMSRLTTPRSSAFFAFPAASLSPAFSFRFER